jgi:hypothetical protein
VNNIKMDHRKIEYGVGLSSFGSGEGPVAASYEHGNESGKLLSG